MKAIALMGLAALGMFAAGSANAEKYLVKESASHYIACYDRVYVPATVAVNTRGKLVRHGGTAWEVGGDHWDYVRVLPVYIETRHVVEPDHYTLVRRGC